MKLKINKNKVLYMTEEEHKKAVDQLEKKYIGKYFKSDKGYVKIIGVIVEYRLNHEYMNRVEDELGNITFINEIKIDFLKNHI